MDVALRAVCLPGLNAGLDELITLVVYIDDQISLAL